MGWKVNNVFVAVALTFILIASSNIVVQGAPQWITIYNGTNCQTTVSNQNYTITQSNIPNPWNNITASLKMNGLWMVGFRNRSNNAVVPIMPTSVDTNGVCIPKAQALVGRNASHFLLQSLTRIGPTDLTTRQLLLYPALGLGGAGRTVTADQRVLNMTVNSFAFFGNSAWVLYRNNNFMGAAICLVHQKLNGGNTYTYNLNYNIPVGSVRLHSNGTCGSIPSPTTMRPPATTKKGAATEVIANLALISVLALLASVKY